jgi:hypothetical protein
VGKAAGSSTASASGSAEAQTALGLDLPPGSGKSSELFKRLTWSGEVAPQKWMNFYTKVLSRFVSGSGLKLTVRVEVAPDGGVSKQKVDEAKSALRELGLSDSIQEED